MLRYHLNTQKRDHAEIIVKNPYFLKYVFWVATKFRMKYIHTFFE